MDDDVAGTTKPPRLLTVILGVLTILVLPAAFFGSRAVSPTMRFVLIIVAALFCCMLLFFGSKATASGNLFGVEFRFRGLFAAFIVFVLAFHFVFPNPATSVVRVFFESHGSPLPIDFSMIARIPGTESVQKRGTNGETSLELDSRFTQVDSFIIDCPGYVPRDPGPFPIVNGVIRLEMIKAERPSPLKTEDFPSISSIPDMPTNADVRRSSRLKPADVSLLYRNLSGQNLRLLLLDCSRYYASVSGRTPGRGYWSDVVLDASVAFTPYNSFRDGTGWVCFFVRDANGNNHYLGRRNIFDQETTKLTVRLKSDGVFGAAFE